MKTRIFSLLLALCLLLALMPQTAPTAGAYTVSDAPVSEALSQSLEDPAFQVLEQTLKQGLKTGNTEVDISAYALTALPQLEQSPYWELGSCTFDYDEDTGCYSVMRIQTALSQSEAQTRASQLETAIAQLDALVASQSTEVDKALALHDYMLVEYAYDLTYSRYSYTDLLLDKTGVCQAYAELYQYILTRAGMKCEIVVSTAMNHAWNLVQVDGAYYHVDVTWDDPVPDSPGQARHGYFLVSDAAIQTPRNGGTSTHYGWDSNGLTCDSTDYDNAFWKNINTPVIHLSDTYYYVDTTGICKRSGLNGTATVLRSNFGTWPVWGNSSSYWIGTFTGLFYLDGYLYYNTATELRRISLDGSKDECVCTADTSEGYFYGCLLKNNGIYCVVSTTPNETGTLQLVEPHSHTHSYSTVVTAPTCVDRGYTTYTCTCGDSYVDNYVNALGHDFVQNVCTRCGADRGDLAFIDVSTEAWFYPYVISASRLGLVNGYEDNTFRPFGSLTRAEAVTLLYRAAGSPAVTGRATFTDLDGQWYQDAICWAQQNKVVNGISATEFAPNTPITREAFLTMIWRYAGSPAAGGSLSAFVDTATVDTWAVTAFAWAVEKGIVNGTTLPGETGLHLAPLNNITRAEAAKILVVYTGL